MKPCNYFCVIRIRIESSREKKKMTSRSVQRARKPNYTREETETLLDQLILYGHFLFNKSQPVNNHQKADVWANIAQQVNAVPNSAGRTVDELKHRWQDMAQRARHALRKNPMTLDHTGKTSWKPVPFLHKILKVLGESQGKEAACQLEETAALLSSLDATYSSDSSSAANIKEEINGSNGNETNQDAFAVDMGQTNGVLRPNGIKRSLSEIANAKDVIIDNDNQIVFAVDQSQGNGSLRSNGMKRPFPESSNFTKSPPQVHLPSETEKVSDTSPSPLNPATVALCDKNVVDKGGIDDCHQRFESKRRRMKKSSLPRKSVSTLSNNAENYQVNYNDDYGGDNYEPVTIQHKHIETFRSMVLDPDSEIIMEVEGIPGIDGDCGSQGSSVSASNLPTNHISRFDFDPLASHHQRQSKRNGEMTHPHAIYRNNKQSSGLPPFIANSNYYNNDNTQKQQQLLQNAPPHLETMSKSDLDRRCIISQIQMQDQRTRYLMLKEQKIKLEMELLQRKCACQNSSNTKTSTSTTITIPTQEVLIPSSSSSSSSSSSDSNHRLTNTFPEPPCQLSISSSVTSFKTKTNCDGNEGDKNKSQETVSVSVNENSVQKDVMDDDGGSGQIPNDDSNLHNKDDGNSNNGSDDENNEGEVEDNEDDVSLMVSFGDDNDNDKDSASLNEVERDNLFGSQSKTVGEDWEKTLQKNIGL